MEIERRVVAKMREEGSKTKHKLKPTPRVRLMLPNPKRE